VGQLTGTGHSAGRPVSNGPWGEEINKNHARYYINYTNMLKLSY